LFGCFQLNEDVGHCQYFGGCLIYFLIAGWVHYLAFDLLVGSWIVKDAQEKQIHHGWIVPILVMTFMFGPLGWASYVVLRNWANGVKDI